MASGHDESRPLGGFHSFADDTPRESLPPDPLPNAAPEPLAAGWSDTPAWRQAEPPPTAPSWRRPLIASAAALALLGAGVGWAVLRDPVAPTASEAVAEAPESPPLEVVVVAPPPPPPIPKASERLEVLPRPGASPARPSLGEVVIPVTPTPPSVVAQAPPAPLPQPRETPSAIQAAQDVNVRDTPPARFNACSDAPTLAYEMVCRDRGLAEADRRMKRAFSAALAAGVPSGALRRDQDDWLEVREEAAQVSPRAVADLYRQRTRELFDLADERRD